MFIYSLSISCFMNCVIVIWFFALSLLKMPYTVYRFKQLIYFIQAVISFHKVKIFHAFSLCVSLSVRLSVSVSVSLVCVYMCDLALWWLT